MNPPSGLQIACIRDGDDFIACRNAWDTLASKVSGSNCFSSHEWYSAAWAWRVQEGACMRTLLFYDRRELIGACPLILVQSDYRGIPIKKLEFLTIPDTQFCDILCLPEWRLPVLDAIADWLEQTRGEWTTLHLAYIKQDSVTWHQLRETFQKRGFHTTVEPYGRNWYIDLSGTWENYYRTRSRRLKKGNNLVANKLRRQGRPHIEWFRSNLDPVELERYMQISIALSANSWKKETGLSLDQPGPNAFFKTITESANHNGWLSLWILYLDEKPLAMEYQLVHERNVYALRSDYDLDYGHLSPGTYLNWQLLQSLFESDFDRYYMGPGENAYKLRWTEKGENLLQMIIFNDTPVGKILAHVNNKLIPMARRIRNMVTSSRETKQMQQRKTGQ